MGQHKTVSTQYIHNVILYVATSRAKTIEHMTQETPQTKMSALYWTGGGMSINRMINGSTKKQPNKQGHNWVDCLKIEKKARMGDILNQATRAHNNRHIQQRPIEKNQEQTRTDH